jgi:hypothetical protein
MIFETYSICKINKIAGVFVYSVFGWVSLLRCWMEVFGGWIDSWKFLVLVIFHGMNKR